MDGTSEDPIAQALRCELDDSNLAVTEARGKLIYAYENLTNGAIPLAIVELKFAELVYAAALRRFTEYVLNGKTAT
jgi:hypothetical protein